MISVFLEDGSKTTFAGIGNETIEALALDNQGTVYASSSGLIYKFNSDGTKTIFGGIYSGAETVNALAFDSQGFLYAGSSSGLIYKFDSDGTNITFGGIYSGAQTVNALAFDSQGFLYAGTGGSGGSIYKFFPNGFNITFANNSPAETTESLCFDSLGNLFSGTSQGYIYKYLPDSTKSTFAYSTYTSWTSLASDANGGLYAGTGLYGGRIYKFDSNGNNTLFSNLGSQSVNALAFSIPEPSTYALFGIGFIGMVMAMRRKKKSVSLNL